jgi:hypothetical protein
MVAAAEIMAGATVKAARAIYVCPDSIAPTNPAFAIPGSRKSAPKDTQLRIAE